jgi:hypothetical protein
MSFVSTGRRRAGDVAGRDVVHFGVLEDDLLGRG